MHVPPLYGLGVDLGGLGRGPRRELAVVLTIILRILTLRPAGERGRQGFLTV